MTSLVGGNAEVVIETVPELMVPEPSVRAPLVNVIVPVGPAGTVAVIVTESPSVLGPDVLTLTVVAALLTTCTSTDELSEFSCAVILCDPTERLDVTKVAVVPTMTLLPILVAPSKKLTTAVLVAGIVAVKVTDCL